MSTTHKLIACIPHGDPDLGAEIECEIAFTYLKGAPEQGPSYYSGGQPADPDEIEFVSAVQLVNGKPVPRYHSAFQAMHDELIADLARDWLETEDGVSEAMATVAADDDEARERAAELKADR